MRKILLALSMLCCVMGAQAQHTQTYTEDVVVTINNETAPTQQVVIDVVFNDNGSMNLTLKDFVLQSPNMQTGEMDMLPVGDITVNDVPLTPAEGYSTFSGSQTINITDGSSLSPFWMGPNLGPITIVYSGQVNDQDIYASIDIDLSQTLQQVVQVRVGTPLQGTATSKYQIDNSDFEAWDDLGTKSEEPAHWNSFLHASGSWASMVAAQQVARSTEVRPGAAGQYSARIYARNVLLGIIAQGNLTTGRINAGSMSATDATGNYNYTQGDNPNFNQQLTGLPDSLRVWMKTSCQYNASVSCILHTEGYYQDPEANEITAQVVATAKDNAIAKSDNWQCITIPFNYELTDGTRPAYALLTLTTSGQPGKGNAKDEMWVDDVEMIYNSELVSAEYDGQPVAFDEKGIATLPPEKPFDPELLTLVTNGRGATVETEFTPWRCGENTGVLMITVKGDDYAANPENAHHYSISFCDDEAHVAGVAARQTGSRDSYDLSGRRVKKLNKAGLYINNGQKVMVK